MDIYELFSVVPHLHLLTFDKNLEFVHANDPLAQFFYSYIDTPEYRELITSNGDANGFPFVFAAYVGFVWQAIYETKEDQVERIHILGPIFYSPYSVQAMETYLRRYESQDFRISGKHKLLAQMKDLPVMSYTQFAQYGMMLHFLVNGEKISISDFSHMHDTSFLPTEPLAVSTPLVEDRDTVYENIYHYESLMLNEVSQGQAQLYLKELTDMLDKGSLASMPTEYAHVDTPARSRRDSLLIMNALECHAAVSAGVLPSVAYRTQDQFIEEIENIHSPLGMNQLHSDIHSAYCALVASARAEKEQYSPTIRKCITYLKNNITSGITTAQLAEQTGYEPYYLNRLFKTEVGMSPKQYYRDLKIHYAARMLLDADISVADVADYLHYSSYTHFCSDFKTVMACTPTDYRNQHK